ncbi:MAG: YibE/F family protein [bacterium]|nr:YibE/F family protein [bacterium]
MKKIPFKTVITLFLFLFLPFPGAAEPKSGHQHYFDDRFYARAEIINIEVKKIDKDQGMRLAETRIDLKILGGELEGKVKTAVFGGEVDRPKGMEFRVGDTYFIGIQKSGDDTTTEYVSIYDIDNTPGLIFVVVLMVLAIIAVGRVKGLASLAALVVTILLFFLVLIPQTLKGRPPLPIAVIISIVSIIITLPIIAGFKLKTLAAILGASGGIIIASLLAVLTGYIMHLSGIVTNEMLTVFYVSDVNIDLRGLVLSGMIIAALGAVMDICISISSSTTEIFNANPGISEKDAFKSVLNIGTDILGSMVNTLILAYVGSSLSMILTIAMKLQPDMPFLMLLNFNPVLNEIVKSAIGSIGMFICIPATAFIAVKLHKRKHAD